MILLQNLKAFGMILLVTWCYYSFSLNKVSYMYSYLYLALSLQV